VIRAQVELGRLTDHLRALRELRGPLVAGLNAALNRPPEEPLPWPKPPPARPVSFQDAELLAGLGESSPELQALAAEAERRKRQVALARKGYFPDVTVGVDYIDTGDSIAGRRPDDDGKDPVIATVSINLPIWRDKLRAAVQEAWHRQLAAELERQQRHSSLSAEVKLALYRFRDAERKIALYGATLLPKAREALKATQASYRSGRSGFSDLIDAQRVLLSFALSHERARADRAIALAELEMLVGRQLGRRGE
jgi:outer membrane protein TolC